MITAADAQHIGPIEAFVDTGADCSILPLAVSEELGAPITDEAWIRGQWGAS